MEITGPTDRKMAINALNSGARIWLADFEDASAPTWENVDRRPDQPDRRLRAAGSTSPRPRARRTPCRDAAELATVVMRPRGWHLDERHLTVDGEPVPGGLVDFGLYFFHNARRLIDLGKGPYFYLPKTESHLEARLWNDVFVFAQDHARHPAGHRPRDRADRDDHRRVRDGRDPLRAARPRLRAQRRAAGTTCSRSSRTSVTAASGSSCRTATRVTMTAPFMRAYTELLVRTCHKRGAHAIGGMAAFIPSRRDAEVNKVAFEKVKADKDREAGDGFDGSWVAHPDLVPIARASFDAVLGDRPHQKDRLREDVRVTAAQLIDIASLDARPTYEGLRNAVQVGTPLHRGVAARAGRGGHLQPDGGRRHRGDLPLADLAVDQRGCRVRGDGQ